MGASPTANTTSHDTVRFTLSTTLRPLLPSQSHIAPAMVSGL
jgi:hypothetical protein